jgi:hypothetical protein
MKKAICIIVASCLFLSSCPLLQRHSGQEMGSLIIDLSTSAMGAKSIVPPLDMEVASYDLSGNGPRMAAFVQIGATGPTAEENTLAVGAWTITVDAFNSNHEPIGAGSADVTIEAGVTTQASVQVSPLAGTGILTIAISWPSGTIAVPVVSGTLTSVGGTDQAISFTMGTDSASYSSGALNGGYYSLILQLSDGTVVEWGSFEAVRILKGQTTTANSALTSQDLLSGG